MHLSNLISETKSLVKPVAVLLLALSSVAPAHSFTSSQVDSLLAVSSGGGRRMVDAANVFFKFLDSEQFTDSLVRFQPTSPAAYVHKHMWYWAAEWFYDSQDYDRSQLWAQKALPLFVDKNVERSDCLNLLAITCVRKGDFSAAASFAMESVEILRHVGDNSRLSSSLNTLAGIYMAAGRPQDAVKFVLEGISCVEKTDNTKRKAVLLGMASEVYAKLGDYGSALKYASKAYSVDSVDGRKPQMAVRLSQKAAALAGLKKTYEAEKAYVEAIDMLRKVGNRHSVGIDLNQLGYIYLNQGKTAMAARCFEEAAGIFAEMNDMYNRVYSHKGLYECYWESNPSKAKQAFKVFVALRDSLYSLSTAETIARYSAEFGNDQLRAENDAIRQQYEEMKKTRYLYFCLFVALLIVVVLLLAFLYLGRARRNKACHTESRQLEETSLDIAEYDDEAYGSDSCFVNAVTKYIEQRMDGGSLRVVDIASGLCLSEQTLRRRLKEVTGESPKNFIVSIQIRKAKKMLADNPELQLSDIAMICGFDDVKSFSQTFKKEEGVSPTAYRNNLFS